MGCTSSKILKRSSSYQEELNHKFSRSYTGLEEVLTSSNGGDQLFFLLSAANTASKRIKSATLSEATETKLEIPHSSSIVTEILVDTQNNSVEQQDTEENKECIGFERSKSARIEDSKHTVTRKGVARSRSYHTVEDYDAFLAAIKFPEVDKHPQHSDISMEKQMVKTSAKKGIMHTELDPIENDRKVVIGAENSSKSDDKLARNRSTKRMEMAKELQPLAVQSSFDFAKSGSLKGWLSQGGQSYVTPKFGSYDIAAEQKKSNGTAAYERDEAHVFDPEMVAQYQQALQQLKSEEDSAFKQIIERIKAE